MTYLTRRMGGIGAIERQSNNEAFEAPSAGPKDSKRTTGAGALATDVDSTSFGAGRAVCTPVTVTE